MSNGILTLRFGESGEIVSCLDAAGGEHAGSGLNRLVLHRDPYVFPFNAWDINRNYLTKPSLMLKLVESSTAIDGPRLVRRHVLTGPRVRVEQTIVLEAGSPLVRFETWVDWHQRHRMLRAEFRPTHFGEQAHQDNGRGCDLDRGVNPEADQGHRPGGSSGRDGHHAFHHVVADGELGIANRLDGRASHAPRLDVWSSQLP